MNISLCTQNRRTVLKKTEKLEEINILKNIVNLDKGIVAAEIYACVISAATFQLKINYNSLGKKSLKLRIFPPPPLHGMRYNLFWVTMAFFNNRKTLSTDRYVHEFSCGCHGWASI